MKRFFIDQKLGETVEFSGMEFHHLVNVLRLGMSAEVTICCGDEFDYTYTIIALTRHVVTLKRISVAPNTANPRANVSVFMAIIKPDPLHIAITNLNEIGARELVLFNADRCNTSPKNLNLEKLNTVAKQSCKQCTRSIPLHVRLTNDEPNIALRDFDVVFFADETLPKVGSPDTKIPSKNTTNPKIPPKNTPDFHHIPPISPTQNVAIVIGPEGGFTPNERAKLVALPNAHAISLGRRILRAETAATVAASIILEKMGELS